MIPTRPPSLHAHLGKTHKLLQITASYISILNYLKMKFAASKQKQSLWIEKYALEIIEESLLLLPGSVLEPGFTTRPRARMISTSNCPFLSIIPTWMSPNGVWERNRQTSVYKRSKKQACAKDLGFIPFHHFPYIFLNSNTLKILSMISYFKRCIN